jgi:hypothetical protein
VNCAKKEQKMNWWCNRFPAAVIAIFVWVYYNSSPHAKEEAWLRNFEETPLTIPNECHPTTTVLWQRLGLATVEEDRDSVYCLYRAAWRRTASAVNQTSCDLMMRNESGNFLRLAPRQKSTVYSCIRLWRLIRDFRRKFPVMQWLVPFELMVDVDVERRILTLAVDYIHSLVNQTVSDRRVPLAIMSTTAYVSSWQELGLNCSHYATILSDDDLQRFRARTNARDYLVWNSVGVNASTIEDILSWIAENVDVVHVIFPGEKDHLSLLLHFFAEKK